ncbi:MAG: cyclic nucleotide-binding domain-containing protein, partial [Spirochaetia bacterium]|nr:cyclic nucleotide-binding domain-containing protein [Spirochaetia bacterium]
YARTLAAGSVIFKMGDKSADAYYLYKGRVHIYLDDPAGGAPPVSSVSEGEFFGELALILDETRSAWAVAAEDVTVFRLPAALFRTVLDQDPEASRRLVTQMASRLSANNRRIKRSDGP